MSSYSSRKPKYRGPRAAARELAERVGIMDEYVDMLGRPRHTSDDTRVALLAAMGIDAADEESARRALVQRIRAKRMQLIEPVEVVKEGESRANMLRLRLPEGVTPRKCEFGLDLQLEGDEQRNRMSLRPRVHGGTVTLKLPCRLGLGYHTLAVTVTTPHGALTGSQTRIVHPRSCVRIDALLPERKAFGIWVNLYSLKSRQNFGVGDFGDLGKLCAWAAEVGAAFFGISPTSSTSNRGVDISPYSPLSRLYHNEIYLDVATVPEFGDCEEVRNLASSRMCETELARLRALAYVDYEAVVTIKRRMLKLLFATFGERRGGRSSERISGYRSYVREQGEPLLLYATYRAIADHLATGGGPVADWRRWPPGLRDPASLEVKKFQHEFAVEIEYHMWVQFELDRQMARVIGGAKSVMPIGVCADLPLAPSPDGADAWAFRGLFATGAHIGAPPDDFAADGQDWGLTPVVPQLLRETRYDYWIRVVRSALRHAGALRIDHVMGLFRQFWIPSGQPGSCGAYVRQPAKDLLGILALESARHGALIIGEDLGTVPAGLQARLERWGILSTRVFYFERNKRSEFRPSRRYSKRALVTAHTHDQVPLAGYWIGRDLQLRRDIGVLDGGEEYACAVRQRGRELGAIKDRLRKEGVMHGDTDESQPPGLASAVYEFLARTPAPLLGVSLDDLAAETDPVNIPGVPADRFPTWSRRMNVVIEDLPRHPTTNEILAKITLHRGSR